jgi:S-DNA-T family DNA segregation ATPase FtsK/SpoIIIE
VEQATRLGHPRLSDYLERAWREGALWLVVIISLYFVLALATYSPDDPGWSFVGDEPVISNTAGRFGAWLADLSLFLVGVFAYLIPVGLAASAFLLFREREPEPETKLYWLVLRWIGLLVTLCAGAGLASLQLGGPFGDLPNGIGGGLGQLVSEIASASFGSGGGSLVLLGLLLLGLSLFTGLSPLLIVDGIGDLTLMLLRFPPRLYRRISAARAERRGRDDWGDDEADDGWSDHDWPGGDWADADEEAELSAIRPGADDDGIDISTEDAGDADQRRGTTARAPDLIQPGPAPRNAIHALEPMATQSATRFLEAEPELEIGVGAGFASAPIPEPAAALERRASESEPSLRPLATATRAPAAEPVWANSNGPTQSPPSASASALPRPDSRPKPSPIPVQDAFSQRPPLDLLDPPRRSGNAVTPEQLETMSRELEARLAEFGVVAEVVEVHPGPVVALFELDLAPGVKVSKITGLSKDIARALSKISVRVVEVIPGKSVIGLEVPNDQREMVTLSEIIGSRAYQEAKSPLTISMGTNISGEPVVADLGRMPHALIAGTTGSGKSVAINAMILSLVYKAGPDDVRLIMVDPKMLELSVYEGIPHLLTPVVTDMKEAANALRWCVGEMERRYKLMASLGVRNIAGYNRKVLDAIAAGEPIADPTYAPIVNAAIAEGREPPEVPTLEKLPNIVVIIDELADMMMVVGKKVEELIARLAQKARASGIHLLLATQRPSVDVLTGLIKANIPTRMAFKVSARVDSRTVLDQMGAEHLLGHGDMLYLPPGGSISQRVHGAFVDDHEVHKVVNFLKQQGTPDYIETILQEPAEHLPGIDPEPKGGGDVEDQDPLFDEAVQIVVESRRASISGVQRRLKIGYNRAARMIEEMERIGIVGPAETNGNRDVLAPPPQD